MEEKTMALKMYNTLTKSKEEFRPIENDKVRMYVCGVTVYDDMHMGHARSIIVFDMIVRYLRWRGYDVTHVTNFTDVDDKIINRANELGEDPLELSSRYIDRFFEDIDSLGVERADCYPKASESVGQIIDLVQRIMDNGYAYRAEDGSVYFSVDKVEDYGRLVGQRLEDMMSGTRVDIEKGKRNPMDFALWKAAKPGEISWDSPWGRGRPGWHIECSAMVAGHLGELIDIHGGGNDLIFPHHEDEILQTEAAYGSHLANYWLHNGMLQIQDEKMSKSLENFFTVRQVLERYTTEEVRFFILNTHYRGPLSYSDAAMDEAASSLRRLHNAYFELRNATENATGDRDASELVQRIRQSFVHHMDDDFNTRGALSSLFEVVREVNKMVSEDSLSSQGARDLLEAMEDVDQVLGILPREGPRGDEADRFIQILVEVREELRKRRAFDLADQIRDRLSEEGVEVEDTAEGVKWKWT
ncbi:MAG: cysteine--tRNA ligase [Methanomassiliicoccales archaeon]